MKRSKILMFLLVGILFSALVFVTGCSSDDDNVLVIYSTFSEDFAGPIIEMFEDAYGVTVELMLAGTGPTLARLRAEQENPQADLMWGGGLFSVIPEADLFEDFTSINEPYMMPGQQNVEGNITRFITSARLLMVNTDLIGDIEIKGYACLLNPALRGQIAITDPAASASSFNHLVNQLYAMGAGNNPHAGWDYMEQFIINTDGIMLPGSSAVHMGVADGEFIVGLTYEEAPFPYIEAGAPVAVVYIDEGIVATSTGVAIVAGARNRTMAENFINFVTSYEIQVFVESQLFRRVVRVDVPSTGGLTANAELNWIPADNSYILEHRDSWLETFQELWMAHH
ncbi:MAG: extracellular solute-binding protein [Defluviitaleaceae bacterium]|nr:extracellular solute-binding protein [Defluviitaleaceae bacterium]